MTTNTTTMTTKGLKSYKKVASIAMTGATMAGLIGGFSWRFVTNSIAAETDDQNTNNIEPSVQSMSEAELIEYANQLSAERQRLIAYRTELEALSIKLYDAQGIQVPAKISIPSQARITPSPVAAPGLVKSIQGNSSGS